MNYEFDSEVIQYEKLCAQVDEAKLYYNLLFEPNWIIRRVESISIIDLEHWKHRVSFDIDIDQLKGKLDYSLSLNRSSLPIPIDILEKNLIIDVDAVDHCNNPISIYPSRKAATISLRVLYGYLCKHNLKRFFTKNIFNLVKGIVYNSNKNEDFKTVVMGGYWTDFEKANPKRMQALADLLQEFEPELTIIKLPDEDARYWRALQEDQGFTRVLELFARHYPLVTEIDALCARTTNIIKFCHVETSYYDNEKSSWSKRLRFKRVKVGRAVREHLRIQVPSGIEICRRPFLVPTADMESRGPLKEVKDDTLIATMRTTPAKVVVCTRGIFDHFNKYDLHIEIRPCATGFFRPSIACLSINAFVTMALFLSFFSKAIGSFGTSEGVAIISTLGNALTSPIEDVGGSWALVVTLLLAIPTFYSAYLTRMEDHRLRATMLRRTRLIVWGVVIATGISAVLFVVKAPFTLLLWLLVFFSSLAVSSLLIKREREYSNIRKEINATMGDTMSIKIFQSE